MARLAYHASQISPDKPSQFETQEGYRIYKNVPICRTGFQEYVGSEIKKNPTYDPAWNIGDDDVVKVYRPVDEVTDPVTLASFEGKSVLDEHPPEHIAIVHTENDYEYSKGHVQNVRIGPMLTDGETPLIADLYVKHLALNDKIDSGIREVSSGYIFKLGRMQDGTLVMTKIRGNHVAVVPKGRAGSEISIRDAARPEIKKEKYKVKNLRHLIGLGLKEYGKDASPEEFAEAAARVGAAHDAAPADKGTAGVALDSAAIQTMIDKSQDALIAKLKTVMAKDAMPDLEEVNDCDKSAIGDADDDEDDDEEKKKKKEAAANDDANVLELEGDEKGDSVLNALGGASDSAKFLKAIKPAVAASKDKAVRDAYNALVRATRGEAPHGNSAYDKLARSRSEAHDKAASHGKDAGAPNAEPDIDPMNFFVGKSFADGQKAYDQYLEKKRAAA